MGEWKDKVEGKAKEAVGTVTGDDSKQMEGKAQGTWGNVEGTAKDAEDTVGSAMDKLRQGGSHDDENHDDTTNA